MRSLRGGFALLLFLGSGLAFTPATAQAGAAGATGLLSIVPGLGQVVNGDALEGGAWFLTALGLYFSGNRVLSQIGYDVWQYNMYDAYRDAEPEIRRYAKYNVAQNYLATFNPANVFDLIGGPVFALGAIGGSRNHYAGIRNPTYIPYYGFVGLGEEGLFRGFIFPALSDWFGTWPGAILSSAMFSAFHVTNGRGALGVGPLTSRFVMGMLFAWQTDRNKYDLRKSIFAHAWWDVFVGPSSPDGVKIDGGMATVRFTF